VILRSVMVLLGCMVVAAICWWSPATASGPKTGVLMKLPERIGGLIGVPAEPTKVELEKLPTDTQFSKMTYFTATNEVIERDLAHVSVVLSGAESRSIHRPEVCLTGQGWSIDGAKTMSIEIVPGRSLLVQDLAISGTFPGADGKAQHLRAHYVYWFVGTDFDTPSHYERLWHSTWDAVVHNVNHRWAYPSVMAYVTENSDPQVSGQRKRNDEETLRLIAYLIKNLVPLLQKNYQP
jgi:Protein of unknown function (DUF3485)